VSGFDLGNCLDRLARRNPGRTEADVQSDIKVALLSGAFDLGEEQVRFEAPAPDRRRIDVEVGRGHAWGDDGDRLAAAASE